MSAPKSANNIRLFPGTKTIEYPKHKTTEDIIADVTSLLIQYILHYKTPTMDINVYEYDVALFIEATKSLIAKTEGAEHPLQSTVKNLFEKTPTGSITFKV